VYKHKDSPPPKNFLTTPSGNVMLILFFTINALFFSADHLRSKLKDICYKDVIETPLGIAIPKRDWNF
jgi:hypothetical protein